MNPGDRLTVIDAEVHQTRGGHPGKKPPFKLGQTVTLKRYHGLASGPDAKVELHGFNGFWTAGRFAPAEG